MNYRSMKFFILIAGLMVINSYCFSQDDQIPVRDDQTRQSPGDVTHNVDIGIGFGLDYGGLLGIQLGFAPVKHVTLFAAGGYYLLGFGYQVGIKGLFISKTSKHGLRPFLKAMYGCHSVITVEGAAEYDKIYKGFTAGFGLELRFGRKKQNGFDFDLNVPLRTPEFWEDYNTMKKDPRVDILTGPIPVAVSIGYHHEF